MRHWRPCSDGSLPLCCATSQDGGSVCAVMEDGAVACANTDDAACGLLPWRPAGDFATQPLAVAAAWIGNSAAVLCLADGSVHLHALHNGEACTQGAPIASAVVPGAPVQVHAAADVHACVVQTMVRAEGAARYQWCAVLWPAAPGAADTGSAADTPAVLPLPPEVVPRCMPGGRQLRCVLASAPSAALRHLLPPPPPSFPAVPTPPRLQPFHALAQWRAVHARLPPWCAGLCVTTLEQSPPGAAPPTGSAPLAAWHPLASPPPPTLPSCSSSSSSSQSDAVGWLQLAPAASGPWARAWCVARDGWLWLHERPGEAAEGAVDAAPPSPWGGLPLGVCTAASLPAAGRAHVASGQLLSLTPLLTPARAEELLWARDGPTTADAAGLEGALYLAADTTDAAAAWARTLTRCAARRSARIDADAMWRAMLASPRPCVTADAVLCCDWTHEHVPRVAVGGPLRAAAALDADARATGGRGRRLCVLLHRPHPPLAAHAAAEVRPAPARGVARVRLSRSARQSCRGAGVARRLRSAGRGLRDEHRAARLRPARALHHRVAAAVRAPQPAAVGRPPAATRRCAGVSGLAPRRRCRRRCRCRCRRRCANNGDAYPPWPRACGRHAGGGDDACDGCSGGAHIVCGGCCRRGSSSHGRQRAHRTA